LFHLFLWPALTGCEVSEITWSETSGIDQDERIFFSAGTLDLNGESSSSMIEVRFYLDRGCQGLMATEAYTVNAKMHLMHKDTALWEELADIDKTTEFKLTRYTWDSSGPTIKVVANGSDAALNALRRCETVALQNGL
jgi:hypothetical protein